MNLNKKLKEIRREMAAKEGVPPDKLERKTCWKKKSQQLYV